jgi:hypothetical protein
MKSVGNPEKKHTYLTSLDYVCVVPAAAYFCLQEISISFQPFVVF